MEILSGILIVIIKAVLSLIGMSMESSAKSDAAAAKKETAAVLDVTDSEKAIRDAGREVERAGLRYEDVFMPHLDNVPQ